LSTKYKLIRTNIKNDNKIPNCKRKIWIRKNKDKSICNKKDYIKENKFENEIIDY